MFLLNRSSFVRQIVALPKSVYFLDNEIREIHVRNEKTLQIPNNKKTSTVQQKNGSAFDYFDWNKMRYFFLNKKKCDKNDVNTLILDFCEQNKNPIENALSYIDYLNENNLTSCKRNTRNHVLRLFISHTFNGVKIKARANDSKILKLCNEILVNPAELTDEKTHDLLLNVLAITSEWTKVQSLINEYSTLCRPSNLSAFSIVAAKAFSHRQPEIGWNMLERIAKAKFNPNCISFLEYWDYCESNAKDFKLNVEKMLFFMKQNEIVVTRAVLKGLQKSLGKNGSSLLWSEINTKSGECSRCNNKLKTPSVELAQFQKLRKEFIKIYLNNDAIANYSSIGEMSRFRQYVNKRKTFDYTIDGLNTASVVSTRNILKQAKMLVSVIKELTRENKRVLIIGRKHMERWPVTQMTFIQKHATLFLTADESDDDPYILVAALMSGPTANFISSDRFEEYAQKLSAENQEIFRQWQNEHQHIVKCLEETGTVKIEKLCPLLLTAQKVNNYWHVPYVQSFILRNIPSKVPVFWACVKIAWKEEKKELN